MSRKKRKTAGTTKPVQTADAFSNPLFHLGYGSQSPLEATEYPLTRMTYDYALLNSLYRSNWVVQNVVGIIPDDMLREGFTVSGAISPQYQQALDRCLRQTQLYDRINEGMRWGRLYGGAAGLILIRGQEDLSKPLDLETILPGTFAGLYIVDRWSGITPGMELVSDWTDPDFGLPKYYDINMADGSTVVSVHHSRILRFVGRELPYLEKMAEMYWGESEVEALYADIVKHDNVAANMAALTFRANVDSMEVENLDQLFSVAPSAIQQRFWNMMQAQSVLKSNFGMQLVNKGDTVKNTQYTFTGLQEIYDSMCLDLSGASRIPVTKLFGRAPAGLNATGESDLQNYYDYVDTLRESKLRPILEKLLPIIAMSVWGGVPEELEIQFPPLWTPTAKEVAEIAKAKAETIIAAFQANLLDQATAQRELKKLAEETSMFDTISEETIKGNEGKTFQDVTALRDPLMGLGSEEEDSPFELAAQDAAVMDYNPNQPRDRKGRWTSGGVLQAESGHGKIKLTDKERVAVQKYVGPDSYVLNEKLRLGLPLTQAESDWMARLDSALEKLPPYQGETIRTMKFHTQEDLDFFLERSVVPGRTVKMDSYTSASTKEGYHDEPDVTMYILSKSRGRDIRSFNVEEQEVLFCRNTSFLVRSRETDNGRYVIRMEEVE